MIKEDVVILYGGSHGLSLSLGALGLLCVYYVKLPAPRGRAVLLVLWVSQLSGPGEELVFSSGHGGSFNS